MYNVLNLLGEKILVRPHMRTTTKGGLIIPETHQEIPTIGQVLKLGTKVPDEYSSLNEGDWIKWYAFASSDANWVKLGGELLLVIRPNDVICTIDENSIESFEEPESIIKAETDIN
jgi:co-chaperonin GroES (HSP10)